MHIIKMLINPAFFKKLFVRSGFCDSFFGKDQNPFCILDGCESVSLWIRDYHKKNKCSKKSLTTVKHGGTI